MIMKRKILWFAICALLTAAVEVNAQVRPPIFEEDFESVPLGGIPDGWDNDSIKGGFRWEAARGGLDGSVCMMYNADGYESGMFAILKSEAVKSQSGLVVEFDYKLPDVNYEFSLLVSYDGGKTIEREPVYNVSSGVKGWVHVMEELPESPTGEITLCFYAMRNLYNMDTVFLDNIVVDRAPQCAMIESVREKALTASTATITWTLSTIGNASTAVDVQLMQDGEVVREYRAETGGMPELTIENLGMNVEYTVRLRPDCGALGKGRWSDDFTFRTQCGAAKLPINKDFEDENDVSCWTEKRDDGGTSMSIAEVGRNGSKAVKVKGSEGTVFVFTEAISHAANDMQISFWAYNSDDYGSHEMSVGLQSDITLTSTYSELAKITLANGEWQRVVLPTTKSLLGNKDNVYAVISIRDFVDYGEGKDLYIDDFKIEEAPDCILPENVGLKSTGSTELEFEWDGEADLEVYNVRSAGDTVLLGVAKKSDGILSGLTASTDYSLRFKSKCSETERSEWGLDSISVRTTAEKVEKIECGFEDGLPAEWANIGYLQYGTMLEWTVTDEQHHSGDSALMLALSYGYNLQPVKLSLPPVEVTEKGYTLSLYIYRDEMSNSAVLNIYASDKPERDETAQLLGTVNAAYTEEPAVAQEGWYAYEWNITKPGLTYVFIEGTPGYGPLYIDDVSLDVSPACRRPSGIALTAGEITDKATVTWSAGGTETEWEITYSYEGIEEPVTDRVTGTPQYEITGLEGNTAYTLNVSVKAVCGSDGESEAATGSFTFRTECTPIDVVNDIFTEDFSTDTRYCWEIVKMSGYEYNAPVIEDGAGYALKASCIIAMPEFNYTSLKEYKLTFEYTGAEDTKLEAGVINDMAYPDETFISMRSIEGPTESSSQYTVTFEEYDGAGRLAFRFTNNAFIIWDASYLNNIRLTPLNPPCPDTELELGQYTANSAEVEALSTGIDKFDFEYGEAGFTHGEGTTLEDQPAKVTLIGLSPDTEYDVYARSVCDNGEGIWSLKLRFRTRCGAFEVTEETPFEDGFEEGLSRCWVRETISNSGWSAVETDGYNSTAHSGTGILSLNGSVADETEADLYYPIEFKAGEKYEFECWYSTAGDATLGISLCDVVGDAAPEIVRNEQLKELDRGGQMRPSQYERLNFVFVPNEDAAYLRIKGSLGMNILGNGIYLDDVAVRKISCEYIDMNTIHVSGLTDVSARIEWGAVSAESYNVKIATKEIDPESETGDAYDGASSAGNVHNATGLVMATTYYIYVQSVCGADGSSDWVGPVTFETMCPETDLALEDFEEEGVLDCWRHEGGSVSESSDTAYSGEVSVLFGGDGVTRLMSPTISVSPLSGYMVSLHAYTESMATVTIGVVPDAGEPGNYLPIVSDVQVSYQEGWKEVTAYFDILGEEGLETYAASKNIIIIAEGKVYIDDVSLQPIPECRKPQNVTINTLTGDEVTFTWTAATGDTYRAVLKQGEETVKELTENVVSPLTIDGLTPAESYTLEMTSVCAGGNESEATTVEFNTQAVYSFPYYNNFDGVAVGNTLPTNWTNVIKEGINANVPENNWIVGVEEDNGTPSLMYRSTASSVSFNDDDPTASIVQSPIIDLTGVEEAQLSFSFLAGEPIDVLLSTDGGRSFDIELCKDIASEYSTVRYSYIWTDVSFDISQYCGQEVVIGIRAAGQSANFSVETYIDDFSVAPENECAVPQRFKATVPSVYSGAVELSVENVPTEQWQVMIGEPGFDPNKGGLDTLTFMEKTNMVTNLAEEQAYDAYARSVCSVGMYSLWAGPIAFVTNGPAEAPCGTLSAPYSEDFDSGEAGCWWSMAASVDYPWAYFTENGGNGVMKFNSRDNAMNSMDILYSPTISVTEAGYSMSVDYIDPAGGAVSIYLSEDGGITYCDTLVDKATGITMWQTAFAELDEYVGKEIVLAIAGVSNYSLKDGAYIYVDNFRVGKTVEKTLRDTSCYESAYDAYGFMIPSGGLSYGENRLTRVALSGSEEPDTLYNLTVYVPNTDYYIEDVYVKGEPYTGHGFTDLNVEYPEYFAYGTSKSCGCDSVTHLLLSEVVLEEEIYDSICEGDTYTFCGEEKNVSGTYTCEETVEGDRTFTTTLHLTVLPSVIERKDTVCEADLPYVFGEQTLTETGVYEKDSTYANGCGCTVRLDLLVVKLEERIDTVICQGSYVEIDGVRYSTEGEHRIQQPMLGGCGRTLILDIKLTPADTVTYYTVACEGKPIYDPGFAGTMVYNDTVLYRTDKTAGGCDSVTKLVAEYHETVEVFDTVNTAENVYRYDGQDLVTPGDYESKGLTADGCDSIHHLHLTFTTGIEGAEVLNLVIAPNPTRTGITAYAEGPWTEADVEEGLTLEILDAAGRRIRMETVRRVPIAIDGLNVSGMYIVRITGKDGTTYTGRLIVK